jgi:hypothetical protein
MKKYIFLFIVVIAASFFQGCRTKLTKDDLVQLPAYTTQNLSYDKSSICLAQRMQTTPSIAADKDRSLATGILSPPLESGGSIFSTPKNQSLFNVTQVKPLGKLQKLLEEALTKHGYKVVAQNSTTPASELLKVTRVLEPFSLLQRSIRLKDEYASDLLIIVELREPLQFLSNNVSQKDSLFFQTWSRSFTKEAIKGSNVIFNENCQKAIDSLFNNPAFLKALEPNGMN